MKLTVKVWGILALALVACEDQKKEESLPVERTAPAPPPPAPTPAPTPSEEPKPLKPKKTLADCPAGNDVSIENSEIEAEIRRKIDKPDGALTKADLKRVRSLNISQIKDRLAELDPCVFTPMTGLKELALGPGDYDDLSPIAGAVQLESLRASISQVKDLKPLEKLTKLDRLDLGRTAVSDLVPLEKLKALTELQLDSTQVEDVAPLAKLTKLERLSIKNTKVADVSALKALKELKFLYIGGTPLDAAPLSIGPIKANGTKVISD